MFRTARSAAVSAGVPVEERVEERGRGAAEHRCLSPEMPPLRSPDAP